MKYLAVDLGNVVCNVKFDNFLNELSKTLNLPLEDVNYFLHRTTKLHDMGLTQISDELRDHFKIKSPIIIQNLIEEWNKVITADTTVVGFLEKLLEEDVKIALLSNIGIEHAALMGNILGGFLYHYSIKFFSCEVGARKPSFLYYKTFLDMNPEFKGCLYLDDRIENVRGGEKLGFKSLHFELDKINRSDLENKLKEITLMIYQN
jgi:FMN phosphatase YigB (HAD superfamily)